jgi:hypothetical protein
MNLRWQEFERAMRPLIREHDLRHRMSFWQKLNHWLNSSPTLPVTHWAFRGVISLGFAAFVLVNAADIRARPDVWLAAVGLWGLWFAVARSQLIQSLALTDPEYRALWMLPVSVEGIFRHLLRRFGCGGMWLLFEFILAYGVLATAAHDPLIG